MKAHCSRWRDFPRRSIAHRHVVESPDGWKLYLRSRTRRRRLLSGFLGEAESSTGPKWATQGELRVTSIAADSLSSILRMFGRILKSLDSMRALATVAASNQDLEPKADTLNSKPARFSSRFYP